MSKYLVGFISFVFLAQDAVPARPLHHEITSLNTEVDDARAEYLAHSLAEKFSTGFTRDTSPHFRRRGLPSRHRKKLDTEDQRKDVLEARKFRDYILQQLLLDRAIETLELNGTRGLNGTLEQMEASNRSKRWADYDPNYNWENGGKEYEALGAVKQESKFEKFAKSWQKNTLKAIFAFSVCSMFICCCVACCKKMCGRLCEICLWHCKEWRDICLNRDPTYRRIRKFADDYGLKIDYDQYKKLKGNYEEAMKKQGHEFIDLSGRH